MRIMRIKCMKSRVNTTIDSDLVKWIKEYNENNKHFQINISKICEMALMKVREELEGEISQKINRDAQTDNTQ